MTFVNKPRRPYSEAKRVKLKVSLGPKSASVILYPYLTSALVGLVEDEGKTRAIYDEEKTIRIFVAEGMNRKDAEEMTKNHKNRQKRSSPLFIKTAFEK